MMFGLLPGILAFAYVHTIGTRSKPVERLVAGLLFQPSVGRGICCAASARRQETAEQFRSGSESANAAGHPLRKYWIFLASTDKGRRIVKASVPRIGEIFC
jgi:hypothetical protein